MTSRLERLTKHKIPIDKREYSHKKQRFNLGYNTENASHYLAVGAMVAVFTISMFYSPIKKALKKVIDPSPSNHSQRE
jgi:hypothetical protein